MCVLAVVYDSAMHLYLFFVVPWVGLYVDCDGDISSSYSLVFVVVLSSDICAINIEDIA